MPGKTSKKRSAPSQAGPTRKKVLREKNVAEPSVSSKSLQRKKPVTQDVDDDEQEDSDEGEEIVEAEEDFGGIEDDNEVVEESPANDVQTKSSRESHKAQKVLLQERRANKQHSALLTDAKRLWAQARQTNISKEERQKHVKKLLSVIRGKVQDVVFKHDASRIVQTIVKHGGQKERDEIASELKGRYKDLAQNKYSKFLVTKLIRHSSAYRPSILREFRGSVVRLLLHRESSSVIADAYELYANAFERALLLQDFYGKEVALFSTATSADELDEGKKNEVKKGLASILQGADPEKRKRILAAVKGNLDLVLNNSDKGAVAHAIFHRVFWEYLSQINELPSEDDREKLRREMFESSQDLLADMIHTKDGSRIVREFTAQGTAKDRKQIVKVLKPHVERICKDEEAQLVLFSALDVIDDTKLTVKSLVTEIISHAPTLYKSPQGRRSLLYLLVPRSTRHFTPAQISVLAETDSAKARTSKKDDEIRRSEIRKGASEGLVNLLQNASRASEMVRDPGGSLVVVEIMLYAEHDKTKAIENVIELVNTPYPSPDTTNPHVMDIPHACRVYKTLLQGGHFSQQTKTVSIVPRLVFDPMLFASLWLSKVNRDITRNVALGGGTFVVAALCERVKKDGSDPDKKTLSDLFDTEVKQKVKAGDMRGKAVLLEALSI